MGILGTFISPTTGNVVTWDESGKHTDTGQKPQGEINASERPQSFVNASERPQQAPTTPQNSQRPVIGTNSITGQPIYGDVAAPQAQDNTYASYLQNQTNPTTPWANLNRGSTTLSESDWNAQNARSAADMARGITFGGGGSVGQNNGASGSPFSSGSSGSLGAYGSPGYAGGSQGVVPWNVTNEQTVESRVAGILASGSPLIQQQRAQSDQAMSSRGLLNSSIARTASDAAAYQAALPIAQADAATFAKASGYNADQQNQFSTNSMNRAAQMDIARLNADTSKTIAGWNNADSARALQLQLSNKTLLDSNAQAAQAFNTGMSAVNNIQMNDRMDATAKTQAIANVWHNVQLQLKTLSAVSGINLNSELQFAGYPGFDDQGRWIGFGDQPIPENIVPTGTPQIDLSGSR